MSPPSTPSSPRVLITPRAAEVVRSLLAAHGPLLFHLSGGCCDGTAPMCLAQGELRLGGQDLLLGEVAGCPFYLTRDFFEQFRRSRLTLDVDLGRGGGFSRETPLGFRFRVSSTLLDEAEASRLVEPLPALDD